MVKTWNENKRLLEEIIQEMVIQKGNQHNRDNIMKFYGKIMEDLYTKQYSYQNYTQLNKHVLSEINEFVKNMQIPDTTPNTGVGGGGGARFPMDGNSMNANTMNANTMNANTMNATPMGFHNISETNHNPNVRREDIHKQREGIFKERMREKQKEMDMFQKKPAKEIDFTDKTEENGESIDNLLERELARRNQDFTYNQTDQDKANEWIYNSGSASDATPNVHDRDDRQIPKIKIHNNDTKTVVDDKTNKKVHFDTRVTEIKNLIPDSSNTKDLPTSPSDNVVSNNLLMKLKQIKSNRMVATDKSSTTSTPDSPKNNVIHPTNVIRNIPTYDESEVIRKINSLQKEMDSIKGLLYKVLSIVSKETESITLETDD